MTYKVKNSIVQKTNAPAGAVQENTVQNATQQNSKSPSPFLFIQPRLIVGAHDDSFEKEADAVADMVMRMPEPAFVDRKAIGLKSHHAIQRQTEEEEPLQQKGIDSGSFIQKKCAECEKEEGEIHRKPLAENISPIIQAQGPTSKPVVSDSLSQSIHATRGMGTSLDFNTHLFMADRFGNDFSAVNIHTDANSVQMNKELHSRAFTVGHDIYFNEGQYQPGSDQGKHLLAHELTHVVQQKGNNQPKNRLKTLSSLKTEPSIQRYTVFNTTEQIDGHALGWVHPDTDTINVADDGRFAVGESGSDAWAESTMISSAEEKLKSIKSEVKLTEGSRSVSGKDPNSGSGGTVKSLKEVKVLNRSGGGRADLTADCGTTARQVCGINDSAKKFAAVVKEAGGTEERYTKSESYRGGGHTTTEAWFESILAMEFGSGLSASAARTLYNNLSSTKKDKFDRKYGINKYASPDIGQAITIDRPKGWNFHFAGVVLKSSGDFATVENFPRAGRTSQSWYFEIYGPKSKRQTFYEEWKNSSGSTAMAVESDQARTGKTTQITNLIADLQSNTQIKALKQESAFWVKVRVQSGPQIGKTGWISKDALSPDILKSINGQETKTTKRTHFVLTSLASGTKLFVLIKTNSWRYVKITNGSHVGRRGWISNKHYEIK